MRASPAVAFFLSTALSFSPNSAVAQIAPAATPGVETSTAMVTGSLDFTDPRLGVGLPLTLPSFPGSQAYPEMGTQEGQLLPVFDDFGDRIYHHEIRAVMKSGFRGMVVGAALGAAVGTALFNAAFHLKMQCGKDGMGDRCSPQEKSIRNAAPKVGAVFGAVSGGYFGLSVSRVPWDKALEIIRDRRRAARAYLGHPVGKLDGGGR